MSKISLVLHINVFEAHYIYFIFCGKLIKFFFHFHLQYFQICFLSLSHSQFSSFYDLRLLFSFFWFLFKRNNNKKIVCSQFMILLFHNAQMICVRRFQRIQMVYFSLLFTISVRQKNIVALTLCGRLYMTEYVYVFILFYI